MFVRIKRSLSLICAAAAALSFSGCYFFPDEEPVLEAPTLDVSDVVYSTYTAVRKDIVNSTIKSGYVVSAAETECYFTKYTGQLKNIYVNPGDMVEEGQLIAEMNNGAIEYELKIQTLEVELAQLNYNNSGSAADKLQLEIEQNTLAKIQDEYDGGYVYAPVSGQVSYVKTLDPGESVDPYDVIVKIVDPDMLQVSATVDETVNFTLGEKVQVEIGGDYYDGEVIRTPKEAIAQGDSDNDTIKVAFTGEAPGFGYLGAIANITRINASAENAVVIPNYVIKYDGDRAYVQILKDGEKIEVDVEVGITNATEAEIISGLSEGDEVIIK